MPEMERLLSAHVDTLGAMVFEVKANGRLQTNYCRRRTVHSIEGEKVTVYTSKGDTFTGTVLTTKAASHVYGRVSKTGEKSR